MRKNSNLQDGAAQGKKITALIAGAWRVIEDVESIDLVVIDGKPVGPGGEETSVTRHLNSDLGGQMRGIFRAILEGGDEQIGVAV